MLYRQHIYKRSFLTLIQLHINDAFLVYYALKTLNEYEYE